MPLESETEAELLSEARQRLASKGHWTAPDAKMDHLRLIHELRVHQIELELQNEMLSDTLTSVNALRAKYLDLYDFAPVGYFTLDLQGNIVELNLRAASMLGKERAALTGRPLREAFDPSSLPAIETFLSAAEHGTREVFAQSLQMRRSLPMPLYVNAQAHAFIDPPTGQRMIRLALMDVTALKMATDDVVKAISKSAGMDLSQ